MVEGSMKILDVKPLDIPDIKVIKFARFIDNRGYFTEHFRKNDLFNHPELTSMKNIEFVQANESYSKKGTIRGLHFQWNPYMGKLVRTLSGNMVDLILDIRIGSETYGKAIAYDMPSSKDKDYNEWIWIPPGFAHGNFFPKNSSIEYLCSGEYSPGCEAGISPLSKDIDWGLCDKKLFKKFNDMKDTNLITEKDRNALNVTDWYDDKRSENFIYSNLKKKGVC
jgi:dTDP-4-dehydrorhamnose 3,5-epimerase